MTVIKYFRPEEVYNLLNEKESEIFHKWTAKELSYEEAQMLTNMLMGIRKSAYELVHEVEF